MAVAAASVADDPAKRPDRSRWGILAVLFGVHSLDSLVRFGMAPLGPLIMADLGIGRGAFGLLSSSLRVSGISVAVASGKVVDRIGVRRSMLVVAIAVPVVHALFVFPMSYTRLVGVFLLTGMSVSLISPLGNAAIMRWFGIRERGLAFGIKQMGVPLGTAVTALALPPLALRFGWQVAFATLGAVVGLLAASAALFYRDPWEASRRRRRAMRGPGGRSLGPSHDPESSEDPGAPGPEGPSDDAPPTAWSQFTLPGMPWLILMGTTFAAVQMCVLTFATPFLEDVGLDLVTAAAYLSISQAAGMVGRPVVGVISDRLLRGRRKQMMLGIAGTVVLSVSTFAWAAPSLGPLALALLIGLVGMSSMAWAGLFFASVLERADARGLGSASGLASTANMSGSLMGAPVFGFIADAAGFAVAYQSFAVLLAGVAVSFALRFDERPGESVAVESVGR